MDESYDRIVRDWEELLDAASISRRNPEKARSCAKANLCCKTSNVFAETN